MTRLLPVFLLAGCPWIGPDLHAANTDVDTGDGSDVVLSLVEPTYGPTGVATELDILGGGFDPDTPEAYQVLVGDRQATVVQATADQLTVSVPTLTQTGPLDVTVIENGISATLDAAYTTYTNRSNGTNPAGTGVIGLLQSFEHVSASWSPTESDTATAFVALTTGAEVISPVSAFAPSLGQCTTVRPSPTVSVLPVEDADVVLADGDDTIALPQVSSGNGYRDTALSVDAVNTTFDLLPVSATDISPSFGVAPLFEMPPPIELIRPTLGEDAIATNGFYVRWDLGDGAPATDFVTARVEVMNADFSSVLETVWCAAAFETGSLRIPQQSFTQWSSNNVLRLYVGRARALETGVDYNLSVSAATAVNWTVGPLRIAE